MMAFVDDVLKKEILVTNRSAGVCVRIWFNPTD